MKYRFIAEYSDGTVYAQSADDVSRQRPDKNAFYDIRHEPIKPESDLVRFCIAGPDVLAAVDLRDGSFLVNGCRFFPPVKADGPCRLYFSKAHQAGFNAAGEEQFHRVTLRLGWECGEQKQILEFE